MSITVYEAFILGVGFSLGSLVVAGTKAVILFTLVALTKKGG